MAKHAKISQITTKDGIEKKHGDNKESIATYDLHCHNPCCTHMLHHGQLSYNISMHRLKILLKKTRPHRSTNNMDRKISYYFYKIRFIRGLERPFIFRLKLELSRIWPKRANLCPKEFDVTGSPLLFNKWQNALQCTASLQHEAYLCNHVKPCGNLTVPS